MLKLLKILIFYRNDLLKAIENETKERKEVFLGMLLGTLGASLLGKMLRKRNVKNWLWKRNVRSWLWK